MSLPIVDVFPRHVSQEVVPGSNPGWDAFENLMHQDRVQAYIAFMEHQDHRVFFKPQPDFASSNLHVENFKRATECCQRVKFFNSFVKWDAVEKRLCHNTETRKKYSDQRLFFKIDNMWLVKQFFTFGLRKAQPGYGHVYQTSDAPMICYRYNVQRSKKMRGPAPKTTQQSFIKEDRMVYDKYIFRPHSTYVVSPGTVYLILTVQKTLFAMDIVPFGSCRNMTPFFAHKDYAVQSFNLPPPTQVGLVDVQEEPPVVREPVHISPLQPLGRRGRRLAHARRNRGDIPAAAGSANSLPVDLDPQPMEVDWQPASQPSFQVDLQPASQPMEPVDFQPSSQPSFKQVVMPASQPMEPVGIPVSMPSLELFGLQPAPRPSWNQVLEPIQPAYQPMQPDQPQDPQPVDNYAYLGIGDMDPFSIQQPSDQETNILFEDDLVQFLNDFGKSCEEQEANVPHPQEDIFNLLPDAHRGPPEKFKAVEGHNVQTEPLDLSTKGPLEPLDLSH